MDGVTAYSVDSTPADCVRFGVIGLKQKYDLVMSGMNCGINVGADMVYSGTLGATFEAARLGLKAIGFSAFHDAMQEGAKYFDEAYEYIAKHNLFEENPIYNVNLPPKSKGVRMTYEGTQYYSDDFVRIKEGEDLFRQEGEPIPDVCPEDLDRDTVAIVAGYITITPLMAIRTNMDVYRKYRHYND
jgi:5'-nucleotidase